MAYQEHDEQTLRSVRDKCRIQRISVGEVSKDGDRQPYLVVLFTNNRAIVDFTRIPSYQAVVWSGIDIDRAAQTMLERFHQSQRCSQSSRH
jgi:hypothetical protein